MTLAFNCQRSLILPLFPLVVQVSMDWLFDRHRPEVSRLTVAAIAPRPQVPVEVHLEVPTGVLVEVHLVRLQWV